MFSHIILQDEYKNGLGCDTLVIKKRNIMHCVNKI